MMSFLIFKVNDFEYVIHQLIDNYFFPGALVCPYSLVYYKNMYVMVEVLEKPTE
jgi:hypothetical protein